MEDFSSKEEKFEQWRYKNHQIWQDVYHVPYKDYLIYIKFVQGTITEFDLLSFKEK
ncbi:type II toxin-antitoxin system MqsR family toxin [Anaerovibrio sp. RM50]|uniref:type II toxin-antitoxin system MqsR family toxin n=1 Tax=Anaerovibrio sp. RM50 TaxID=1200557 RepID=UPI000A070580